MTEITNTKQGDYLMPDLIPPESPKNLGVWGERRRHYLRDHKDGIYTGLLVTGKLNAHLAEIDKQAEDMFFRLVKQMSEREGVTEQLKAENQMEWVGRMNNIRSRAMEIVNSKIIFN